METETGKAILQTMIPMNGLAASEDRNIIVKEITGKDLFGPI